MKWSTKMSCSWIKGGHRPQGTKTCNLELRANKIIIQKLGLNQEEEVGNMNIRDKTKTSIQSILMMEINSSFLKDLTIEELIWQPLMITRCKIKMFKTRGLKKAEINNLIMIRILQIMKTPFHCNTKILIISIRTSMGMLMYMDNATVLHKNYKKS